MVVVLLQNNKHAYAYAKQEADKVAMFGKQWHQFQNIKSLALLSGSTVELMAKLNALLDNGELTASQRNVYRRVCHGLLAGFVYQEARISGKAIVVVMMDEYQHNEVKGLEQNGLYPSYTLYSSLGGVYTCVYLMPDTYLFPDTAILKQFYLDDIINGYLVYYKDGKVLGQKPPTVCDEYNRLVK